jgi:hypothetical protein
MLTRDFTVVIPARVTSSLKFMMVFVTCAAGFIGARLALVVLNHEYIGELGVTDSSGESL